MIHGATATESSYDGYTMLTHSLWIYFAPYILIPPNHDTRLIDVQEAGWYVSRGRTEYEIFPCQVK